MKKWLSLILGLPTANATARMRAWRALKASGAAVLRDGVYLLPDNPACREAMVAIERDILAINGTTIPKANALSRYSSATPITPGCWAKSTPAMPG